MEDASHCGCPDLGYSWLELLASLSLSPCRKISHHSRSMHMIDHDRDVEQTTAKHDGNNARGTFRDLAGLAPVQRSAGAAASTAASYQPLRPEAALTFFPLLQLSTSGLRSDADVDITRLPADQGRVQVPGADKVLSAYQLLEIACRALMRLEMARSGAADRRREPG